MNSALSNKLVSKLTKPTEKGLHILKKAKGRHKIMSVMRILTVLSLLVVGIAASLYVFAPGVRTEPGNDKKSPSSQILADLSGFEAGAKVSYTITSKDAPPLNGQAHIDEEGGLQIPRPQELESAKSELIYRFSVDEKAGSRSLSMRQDSKTGGVVMNGRAGDAFSDIKIQTRGQEIETRADWAGLFAETGIKFDKKDAAEPIQVAFYSRDIATDARDYASPALIKVFSAPGGGGLTSANVNVWTETNCAPYPLSTCNVARVNAQNNWIVRNYVYAMMMITEQISAVAMQSAAMIGQFLDAKHQLESQRLFQKLTAQAHKDYHPSEQMCRIGSYMRSVAEIEEKVRHDQAVLNDILIENETNRVNVGSALGAESDFENRLEQYKTKYCDPNDNNAGLDVLCANAGGVGAPTNFRKNKDIDYARTVEYPYTLNVDFTNSAFTDEEEDVIALGRNLYWSDVFSFMSEDKVDKNSKAYMRARQLMALNNLAHNTYTKQVAMKAQAPPPAPGEEPGWTYMKTMLTEMGLSPANVESMIGTQPSYYAQMDILTKKIYQNPDFYTNLYSKPANIDRVSAALEAINMMQQRDHFEASLRREMLLSGLIENELITDVEKLRGEMLE